MLPKSKHGFGKYESTFFFIENGGIYGNSRFSVEENMETNSRSTPNYGTVLHYGK